MKLALKFFLLEKEFNLKVYNKCYKKHININTYKMS